MENKTLEKYNCDICGAELVFLFLSRDHAGGEKFDIYRCPSCGLAMTGLDKKSSDLFKYYSARYYGRRKSVIDRVVNQSRWRRVKNITRSLKSGVAKNSLLDVGCGNGGFLSFMAEKGWAVAGTEIAGQDQYDQPTQNFICRKELAECGFTENSFDMVTMWHSLEHFAEPLVYLKEARRVLDREGVLLLEVPNFGCWQAAVFKNNWFHLDSPRHIFHYDKKSMEAILKKAGFDIIGCSCNSFFYSFFGFMQSCLNVFCGRKNFLFDVLNGKMDRRELAKNYIDALVTFFLVWPIGLLALAVFLSEIIFNKGSILIVWAQKNVERA